MTQIIVMVEEPSIEIIAKAVAEKLGFLDRTIVIPHEGKNDLEASFPRKLMAWNSRFSPRFVICRDNDGGNCLKLKARLVEKVPPLAVHPVKFRIVVQELESWYLGDLLALEHAGLIPIGKGAKLSHKRKYKDPERVTNAKQEFQGLVGGSGQLKLARQIAPHLNLEANSSKSFGHFVNAIKWAATS